MTKTLQRFTANISGVTRREKLEGRDYIVAPASILAEGVWPGSNGPLFYRERSLVSSVPSWNHKPVVVYHPKNKKGEHESACQPHVMEKRKVGIILGTEYDDKLRTEVWVDILKANEVDKRIVPRMEKGEVIECSTGVYTQNIAEEGVYNERPYSEEATELAPDHLAILPTGLGAYSVQDGGGILQVNEAGLEPESILQILHRSAVFQLGQVGAELTGNDISFSTIMSQLCDLLRTKFGEPGKYWTGYVCEVYPDKVVFEMDSTNQKYMIGYEVTGDVVSLTGDAKKVERVVEYRSGGKTYKTNSAGLLVPTKTEAEMAAKKFDKAKHIDSLIGNGWEEADRVELEKTPDSVLAKLFPQKDEEEEIEEVELPTVRKSATANSREGLDELQILVSKSKNPATRHAFKQLTANYENAKSEAIATIKKFNEYNPKPLKDKVLQSLELDVLEAMASVALAAARTTAEETGTDLDIFDKPGSKANYMFGAGAERRPTANVAVTDNDPLEGPDDDDDTGGG